MKRVVRMLVPAILAVATAASLAAAQTAPPGPGNRPTPETMQRMQDGKIAMAKSALKMTDAQLKLWAPVEDQIRANQAARVKSMQERMASHDKTAARPSAAERLERHSTQMATRAERAKAFAAVFRPFYDSLSAEQQAVAGPLLAEFQGGRHRGGHRMAEHHGRGPMQQ